MNNHVISALRQYFLGTCDALHWRMGELSDAIKTETDIKIRIKKKQNESASLLGQASDVLKFIAPHISLEELETLQKRLDKESMSTRPMLLDPSTWATTEHTP